MNRSIIEIDNLRKVSKQRDVNNIELLILSFKKIFIKKDPFTSKEFMNSMIQRSAKNSPIHIEQTFALKGYTWYTFPSLERCENEDEQALNRIVGYLNSRLKIQ